MALLLLVVGCWVLLWCAVVGAGGLEDCYSLSVHHHYHLVQKKKLLAGYAVSWTSLDWRYPNTYLVPSLLPHQRLCGLGLFKSFSFQAWWLILMLALPGVPILGLEVSNPLVTARVDSITPTDLPVNWKTKQRPKLDRGPHTMMWTTFCRERWASKQVAARELSLYLRFGLSCLVLFIHVVSFVSFQVETSLTAKLLT